MCLILCVWGKDTLPRFKFKTRCVFTCNLGIYGERGGVLFCLALFLSVYMAMGITVDS